jgi:hypothetical protein
MFAHFVARGLINSAWRRWAGQQWLALFSLTLPMSCRALKVENPLSRASADMRSLNHQFLIVTAIVTLIPSHALAWGSTGHRFIGEIAIRALPDEIPAFLRTADAARQVGELAREPDRWRGSGDVHDKERDPGHFVDIGDDLSILGGPKLLTLPPTRMDYDTALRAVGTTQYKAGYLPYSIIDGFQQLKTDFAYWRADSAGERFGKTSAARGWFEQDRALREALVIRDLGVWSHFVEDGSQPLHVSVHYDGWGDFPNPEGFSTQRGIHAHFEGAFVRANVKEADVMAAMPPYWDDSCAIEIHTADVKAQNVVAATAPYHVDSCPIEVRTSQYLAATEAEVVPFYRLEKVGAFASGTVEGKSFAAARLAAGAAELRDMIVAAWRESGNAKVGYPPVPVSDIESGKADALGPLQGED